MNTDDIAAFQLPPEMLRERRITPQKIAKRREHWVRYPMSWIELMEDASGKTFIVILLLLYLYWKGKGAPIKLANGMLKAGGVSRDAKWRALIYLERRGLIYVERRSKRSPIVTVHILRGVDTHER
jgi:hypothetical protein